MVFKHVFGVAGPTGYSSRSTAEEAVQRNADRVEGKVIFITGCNTGIGLESARVLAAGGAHVVMACRDVNKMKAAAEGIVAKHPNAKLTQLECDLTSFESIRACAKAFTELNLPLHVLLNNAGIMACPAGTTKDGIELQFGTNVVGHFLLTNLLLPVLKATGTADEPARVINVSSMGHKAALNGIRFSNLGSTGYNSWIWYGQSKLGNILHSKELMRRMKEEEAHVVSYSLHPGMIATELGRNNAMAGIFYALARPVAKSIPQGAATQTFLAVYPVAGLIEGAYYSDCNVATPSGVAQNAETAKKMWEVCEKLIENPRETNFVSKM